MNFVIFLCTFNENFGAIRLKRSRIFSVTCFVSPKHNIQKTEHKMENKRRTKISYSIKLLGNILTDHILRNKKT